MVGVSRIYGQLWSCYYVDVNQFFTNMSNTSKKSALTIDMEVEKVPVESITVGLTKPDALGETGTMDSLLLLDLDSLNLNLLHNLTLAKTPEQVRRSNLTSASSATRDRPSIDVARGDLKTTSLSGPADPMIGTQFGANDQDMAFYGFEYQVHILTII